MSGAVANGNGSKWHISLPWQVVSAVLTIASTWLLMSYSGCSSNAAALGVRVSVIEEWRKGQDKFTESVTEEVRDSRDTLRLEMVNLRASVNNGDEQIKELLKAYHEELIALRMDISRQRSIRGGQP